MSCTLFIKKYRLLWKSLILSHQHWLNYKWPSRTVASTYNQSPTRRFALHLALTISKIDRNAMPLQPNSLAHYHSFSATA